MPASPPQTLRAVLQAQWIAVACCCALIAVGAAWELWLAPTGRGTLALKVVPLLFAVPGLARRRMYTYRWTSLLVWLYVAEGAVRAASEHGVAMGLAMLQVALSLALFAACVVHIRRRLAAAPAPT